MTIYVSIRSAIFLSEDKGVTTDHFSESTEQTRMCPIHKARGQLCIFPRVTGHENHFECLQILGSYPLVTVSESEAQGPQICI